MNKIIFLLDKSGSMYERIDDTIGGFNAFVEDQKQFGGTLSLYTFSDSLHCMYRNVSIDNVSILTRKDYVPHGNTALYDAIGEILNMHDDEGKFVILTDGQENSSRRYTKAHVKDLIKRTKLEVVYAGADIDDARDLNIHTAYHYDGHATPDMFRLLSQTVSPVYPSHFSPRVADTNGEVSVDT